MRPYMEAVAHEEEIEPGSPDLEDLGLQIMEVSGEFVACAQQLPGQYNHLLPAKNGPKPSHNDYLALALAKQEACTLPTGDTNLRVVANKEQVNIMGPIGLLCAMIENQLLSVDDALKALDRMKSGKRRLPWPEAEKVLNVLR